MLACGSGHVSSERSDDSFGVAFDSDGTRNGEHLGVVDDQRDRRRYRAVWRRWISDWNISHPANFLLDDTSNFMDRRICR